MIFFHSYQSEGFEGFLEQKNGESTMKNNSKRNLAKVNIHA
jgi:hypothetical protein